MADLIKLVEQEFAKVRENIPGFKPGDTINVHVKIKEGNKERIQQFQGTVIQRRGAGTNGESFTVRKISNGVGVERIFPIVSPNIDKIEIVKEGKVRRAKLYYLKGKHGKAARIREKVQEIKTVKSHPKTGWLFCFRRIFNAIKNTIEMLKKPRNSSELAYY